MPFELKIPNEVLLEITGKIKNKRLDENLTQSGLGLRAGISAGTVKHFEKTGKISFENLLKIAMALGVLGDFDALLKQPDTPVNLFNDEPPVTRRRGKIK